MRPGTRAWILIVVAVAVLAGIIFYVWSGNVTPNTQPAANGNAITLNASALPAGAPLGAVTVNGLPSYVPSGLFIGVDNTITILNGVPGATPTSTASTTPDEFVGQWQSNMQMPDLASSYLSYFQNNGWNILGQSAATETQYRALKAGFASSTALVTISPINNSSIVTVDYKPQQ